MVIIEGKFEVKPQYREQLLTLAGEVVEPVREERGCITFSYYEDMTKPNSFLFYQEWISKGHAFHHLQGPNFAKFTEQFYSLLKGSPKLSIHEVSNTDEY